jgi:hypothetical protein
MAPSGRTVLAPLIVVLVALSVGCDGAEGDNDVQSARPQVTSVAAAPTHPSEAVGSRRASERIVPDAAPPTNTATLGIPAATFTRPVVADVPVAAPFAPAVGVGAIRGTGEATTSGSAATVEELLAEGLHQADASPVHLAIRGTPAADSVRCGWRGIVRTSQQREDAIRFWLRLDATESIPSVAALEILFAVVLDALDPPHRETAKANFLAIARGGESMDYQFLTCFAD